MEKNDYRVFLRLSLLPLAFIFATKLKNHSQLVDGIYSGQITIIPEPKSRGFQMDSLTEQPFGVTLVELAIICPDLSIELPSLKLAHHTNMAEYDRFLLGPGLFSGTICLFQGV